LVIQQVSDDVREAVLEAQNQTRALGDFFRGGTLSLPAPKLGDLAAKVSDQPI
jgi:hypothetical protein